MAVLAAIDRPGVWQRHGMSGVMTGLAMTEALASVPRDCDRDLCRELFAVAEAAFLADLHKRQAQSEPETEG